MAGVILCAIGVCIVIGVLCFEIGKARADEWHESIDSIREDSAEEWKKLATSLVEDYTECTAELAVCKKELAEYKAKDTEKQLDEMATVILNSGAFGEETSRYLSKQFYEAGYRLKEEATDERADKY